MASAALLTFGEDYTALRNTIICMAFSRPSAAATAVLRSILALSSLHRHGYQPQAVRYRGSAVLAMRESVYQGIDGHDAVQHIAAGMMLGCYEASKQQSWDLLRNQSLRRLMLVLQKDGHCDLLLHIVGGSSVQRTRPPHTAQNTV